MNQIIEHSPLPSRHAVRTTIEDLIGRDLTMRDGLPVPARASNVVGVYVTDRLATSALVVLDIGGAARLGGALGLLTRGAVDDVIASREMPTNLRNNCYEVLNVLSVVFNLPGHPHVRLYEMYGPGAAVPPDVAALTAIAGSRMDVDLSIAGYGDGVLSIVVR